LIASENASGFVSLQVSDFQSFLVSNGGHTGSWDVDEHAKFVNVFSTVGEDDEGKLMMRLCRSLPGKATFIFSPTLLSNPFKFSLSPSRLHFTLGLWIRISRIALLN
jgi:hypothetical protein